MNHAALRAWSAAAVPPVALTLLQQGWGQTVRQACGGAGLAGVVAGTGCLVLLAAAALVAWPARREAGVPRFVAWVAMGEAAIFGLAILFQVLAGLIVPSCWR